MRSQSLVLATIGILCIIAMIGAFVLLLAGYGFTIAWRTVVVASAIYVFSYLADSALVWRKERKEKERLDNDMLLDYGILPPKDGSR